MGAELMARMGEQIVSADSGDTLVALGLGSCIGVALLDRLNGLAGLSHVMLADSGGDAGGQPAKYADTAIAALLESLLAVGARRFSLEAVIAGGASMFAATSMEVGARNERAV